MLLRVAVAACNSKKSSTGENKQGKAGQEPSCRSPPPVMEGTKETPTVSPTDDAPGAADSIVNVVYLNFGDDAGNQLCGYFPYPFPYPHPVSEAADFVCLTDYRGGHPRHLKYANATFLSTLAAQYAPDTVRERFLETWPTAEEYEKETYSAGAFVACTSALAYTNYDTVLPHPVQCARALESLGHRQAVMHIIEKRRIVPHIHATFSYDTHVASLPAHHRIVATFTSHMRDCIAYPGLRWE